MGKLLFSIPTTKFPMCTTVNEDEILTAFPNDLSNIILHIDDIVIDDICSIFP